MSQRRYQISCRGGVGDWRRLRVWRAGVALPKSGRPGARCPVPRSGRRVEGTGPAVCGGRRELRGEPVSGNAAPKKRARRELPASQTVTRSPPWSNATSGVGSATAGRVHEARARANRKPIFLIETSSCVQFLGATGPSLMWHQRRKFIRCQALLPAQRGQPGRLDRTGQLDVGRQAASRDTILLNAVPFLRCCHHGSSQRVYPIAADGAAPLLRTARLRRERRFPSFRRSVSRGKAIFPPCGGSSEGGKATLPPSDGPAIAGKSFSLLRTA
jgi:hypothetical protein